MMIEAESLNIIRNHTKLHKLLIISYWIIIYFANLTGYINIHSFRHFAYINIFGVKLDKSSIIYSGCRFFDPWGVHIGANSIIGDHAFLDGRGGIYIGNNVNIAGEIRIYTAEHDIHSPSFATVYAPVRIKDYAYIGSRVILLPNVTIGEGAVVASGALVAKDVASWTMVGGVPAKFIKERPIVKYKLDTRSKAYFQ